MPIIKPTPVKVQGNTKVIFVATLVAPAAPKMTEVSAVSSLDLSGYFMADGWAPSVDVNKGSAPRRLFTRKQFEQFGITQYTLGDLMYSFDPQGAAASNGVKAYEKLTPGLTGYFLERQGLDADTVDYAIGQFVAVWPVTLGDRLPMGDVTDEFAEYTVRQPVIVPADRTERVALVA